MTDNNCLFCRILRGDIPADKVYEDDDVYAFNDINPQAPVHILIIPKEHIPTVADVNAYETPYMDILTRTANTLAKEQDLSEQGYRLVVNCGGFGGQEVYHLHLHLLAGRQMTWPPG